MISYLSGTILEKGADFVILKAGPVGYRVWVGGTLGKSLQKAAETGLYIHEHVREDSRDFFGFATFEELRFFWRLIELQGVGARMAMQIMALGEVKTILKAIDKGDIAFISSAKGVGKKTAQRIVLELKGKLVDEEEAVDGATSEIVSALENLGYTKAKARAAAASVPPDGSPEDRIKMALRLVTK